MTKDDIELLTPAEASKLLRLSPRTLEEMRARGTGPDYLKSSKTRRGAVRYRVLDVLKWLKQNIVTSQSTAEVPVRQDHDETPLVSDLLSDLKSDENALMTAKETAAHLRINYVTLTTMRRRGDGPKFFKMGRGKGSRIAYRKSDVAIWLEQRQFEFTGQYASQRGCAD